MPLDRLVERARDAIGQAGETIEEAVFDRLAGRLSCLHGDVTHTELYERLTELVKGKGRPLYYLEMPPTLFGPIVEQLGRAGLAENARVAVEKPFGHDLDSARALNAQLHQTLTEQQILRVDRQ